MNDQNNFMDAIDDIEGDNEAENIFNSLAAPIIECVHGINIAAPAPDGCCEECKYWDTREATEEARFDAMHDGDFEDYPFWLEGDGNHESN